MKTTKSIIVVMFMLLVAQVASAFYCPATGRWLSRDPIGEPGFQVLQAATYVAVAPASQSPSRWINRDPTVLQRIPKTEVISGVNLYAFVLNSPVNQVDVHGLSIFQDPPSGVKSCREPGLGGHGWLEYPGGSVGFYPGTGDHPLWPGGPGQIHSPDDHTGDGNKICTDVPLSECCDKQKFQQCIKNQASQPPDWYCVVGSNCRDWADAAIRKCKREACHR